MMVPRRIGAWEHAHMNRFNPALLAAGLAMCLTAGAASAQSSGYGGYNGGPEQVADDIYRAQKKGKNVVYTKWIWRWIMLVIRNIPEWQFKKMSI